MPLIPHANDQFAAVQESCLANFWRGVSFVPNHKLKSVKFGVKCFVPFPEEVVAGKTENVTSRFEYPLEFVDPFCWLEIYLVPLC